MNGIESLCEWDIYEILALQMITFCVAYVDEERRRGKKKKYLKQNTLGWNMLNTELQVTK